MARMPFSAPITGGPWTTISSDHGARSPSESVWVVLARNAISHAVSGNSLYLPSSGGLYVVDGLPQPMP